MIFLLISVVCLVIYPRPDPQIDFGGVLTFAFLLSLCFTSLWVLLSRVVISSDRLMERHMFRVSELPLPQPTKVENRDGCLCLLDRSGNTVYRFAASFSHRNTLEASLRRFFEEQS